LALAAAVALSPLAGAAPLTSTATGPAGASSDKRSVFSFGVTGARHSLKAGNGHEVLGNSGAVQLGMGQVADSWYVLTSLDIVLGPYERALNQQLDVDYFGTGLTGWLGFSAQTLDLRSREGGYGFALGLSYTDIVGRSIGSNRDKGADGDGGGGADDQVARTENYVMRVNNLSLLPAIFFSWLEPGRPKGNSPEQLATRLEGYLLTIGAAMPLVINYQAKFERRIRRDVTADASASPEERAESAASVEPDTESGRLRGYSVLVTLTALLGT
jgi:hypothetical protein